MWQAPPHLCLQALNFPSQAAAQKARNTLPPTGEDNPLEKENHTELSTNDSDSTPLTKKAPPSRSLPGLPSFRRAFRSGHKSSRML